MSETASGVTRHFEPLELIAAILLGAAAIATAVASFQSSLYDGKSSESYSKANKLATEAAAERSRAVVEMAKDNTTDVEAMRLILEGDDAESPTAEERNYQVATYLYTTQMSDAGYKALGLPQEARDKAATENASEDKQLGLQEQILEKAMQKDLASDEGYRKEMMAKSQTLFDQAEKTFLEGQENNENGDKFQLAAVLYAISLFFGGIVQVFRNDKMRWVVLGAGALLFICASIYMLTIPWTT